MSYPYKTILLRRGTASEWVLVNPVLNLGEPGYETDTKKLKIGNGTDSWTLLPYLAGDSGEPVIVDEDIDDRVAQLLQAGTNVSIQYDDENNRLIISAASVPTDPLIINQQVDTLLRAGDYINLNYNDSDALTISVVGVQPSGSYAAAAHSHAISDVTNLSVALSGKAALSHNHEIADINLLQTALNSKQASGNYATLVDGQVPVGQLPGFVQDIEEYTSLSSFPPDGSTAKMYLALDTSKIYRWSGSTYVEIIGAPGSTDAIPEGLTNRYFTSARASASSPVQTVAGRTGNIVLGKSDVNLGNVDNTADTDKPISTATATALNLKANTNHTHIAANITDFNSAVQSSVSTEIIAGSGINISYATNPNRAILTTDAFQPAGNYATLIGGRVPPAQLPSYVDEIQEYASSGNFPTNGNLNVIYRDATSGDLYRWSGTIYLSMSTTIEGTTDNLSEGSVNLYFTTQRSAAAAPVQSVAGKTGTVTLSKTDVGLANVDNTTDLNKPISTATQNALNNKASSTHFHIISDITGLQTALDNKQTSGDYVTAYGLNERISSYLQAGDGIALAGNTNSLSIISNGLSKVLGLGPRSGINAINYGSDRLIQTVSLGGTAIILTKGTGWPTIAGTSADIVLKITVTAPTSITWSIINEWYTQPQAGAFAVGTHLVLLRAVGTVIEGHYIGQLTGINS